MGFGRQYGRGAFGGSSSGCLARFIGGSTASASAVRQAIGAGTVTGASTFIARAGSIQLESAFFQGGSTFQWEYVGDAAATFLGSSMATAAAMAVRTTGAFFQGGSIFLYGELLPIQGTSFFSVLARVDAQLPPIKAVTMGPKTFRWLQALQRGDLSVFIHDGSNAIAPVRVAYSLAQLRLDGSRKYVGPQNRTPVKGSLGEFYATGRAGESGQPGQWIIEWLFQRTFQSDVQRTEMYFQVLDAVAVGDPREQLERRIKFGWS